MTIESQQTVLRAVAAMEEHTGTVPGYRRAHARGVVFHATFTPAATMPSVTTAEHFAGPPVPALVRLSNAAGSPYAPDRKPGRHGATLGLAIRFDLPSGAHASWAGVNLASFPARDAAEFIRITELQNAETGRPSPRILGHLATHPHVLPAVKGIAGLPETASFAATRFNGLHTYYAVGPDGARRAFRYSWVPEAPAQPLTDVQRRSWPPQYLISEIRQHPAVGWTLRLTFAAPEDPVDDVTRRWPDDRETVDAGRLVLGTPVEDQAAVELTVFDPTAVVAGIELSDDPILHFRSQVYSESYSRRSGEERPAIKPE